MWTPGDPVPDAFLALPGLVYADDPDWLPEDPAAVRARFAPHSPYLEHGRATLVTADGEARLAGFFDPRTRIDGRPAAFFGFWETIDAAAPNERLFRRIEAWARAQGAERIYGPVDFNTFGNYRLRIDASPGVGCFPGEPYNPPYYPPLLEALGYREAAYYVSQGSRLPYPIVTRLMLAARWRHRHAPPGFRVEPLTGARWLAELPDFHRLIDAIFGDNPGYTSLSPDAFAAACGEGFARRLCPQTSLVAHTDDGTLAGFFLTFPDYAPLLRQGNPGRFDAGELSFDRHFPLLERPRYLGKTLGVHPDYRRLGLFNHLGTRSLAESRRRYADGLLCLIRADNPSARYGFPFADALRTYALYARDLT